MNHKHWQEDPWVSEPDGEVLDLEPSDYELTDPSEPPESNVDEAELEDSDDSVFGQFRQKIGSAVTDAIKGLPTLPEFSGINQAIKDGQREVYDLYRRLSPLEEYASAYMDGGEGLWQGGKLAFPNLIVGSSGVTLVDGGMRLDDHGMWRIDTQIWVDYWVQTTTGIPDSLARMEWEIRVLRPNRSLYHRKRGRGFFPNSQTSLPLATTVVTPEAGYIVELHVTHIVAGRSLFGGEDRTHMTAHHMNREPADRPNV